MNSSAHFASELACIAHWEERVHALVDWNGEPLRPGLAAGSLAGWTVVVKDIIDVSGVPTRFNAPFIPSSPAIKNATIVELLEDAGAAVLAKAVTTTFAFYDPGPTRNPWKLEHTPGGSSSGSAAAVACGMARIAIGTQTVGSINRPASYCGVVGFKPTFGALPTEGVFPLAAELDTVGLFARTVRDAEEAFCALARVAPALDPSSLRIAVVENLGCEPADASMLDAVRATATQLGQSGHHVGTVQLPEHVAEAYPSHWQWVASGAALAHRTAFAEYGPAYPPKLRELIERGEAVRPSTLDRIREHRARCHADLSTLFEGYDVILSPSAPGPAPHGIGATGDPRLNLLWTYLGWPALTVPAGLTTDRLPLGVQLTAPAGADSLVLRAGRIIEDVLALDMTP